MKRLLPRFVALAASVTVIGGLVASPALAGDVVAATPTLLPPSALTLTSVQLNAVIDTKGQAVQYSFEYGPDATYGNYDDNAPQYIPAGATAPVKVSAPITELDPNTKYHYRLDVVVPSTNASYYAYQSSMTGDSTFSTASLGHLVLTSSKITIGTTRQHPARIGLSCVSKVLNCRGTVRVQLRVRSRVFNCISRRYNIGRGHRVALSVSVSNTCFKLTAATRSRTLGGSLVAASSNNQPRLTRNVTLRAATQPRPRRRR